MVCLVDCHVADVAIQRKLPIEICFYKPQGPVSFSMCNHHKYLSQLFLIHLNTYAMGVCLL